MKRRGGFLPNEVRYPRPALESPGHMRSLGLIRHRTAPPFPAGFEKRRGAWSELFSSQSRGGTPHFPANGAVDRWRSSSEACPCRRERVGRDYLTSLGRKPITAPSGLFATVRLSHPQDVFACVGGPQSSDATLNEGPGGKRTHACVGAARSILSNEVRPFLLTNGECPHYPLPMYGIFVASIVMN